MFSEKAYYIPCAVMCVGFSYVCVTVGINERRADTGN